MDEKVKMRVYISGKMTGYKNFKTKFDTTAEKLRNDSSIIATDVECQVFNPCDWDEYMIKQELSYFEMLTIDLEYVTMCDAIYMLDNWKDSLGACVELYTALNNGLFIEFENRKKEYTTDYLYKYCRNEIESSRVSDAIKYITNKFCRVNI